MIKKMCILLHGPFHESAYAKIFNQISKIKKDMLSSMSIVIVCYVSDYEKTVNIIKNINDMNLNVKIVTVKDVVNPGFFNINRQIVSVRTGLENIEEDCFVIKLRNDQYINFNKLIKIINNYKDLFQMGEETKILTTNCFTRKDRLYHPSDMFLCGMQPVLRQYYSLELRTKTHDSAIMEMIQEIKSSKSFEEVLRSPEIELCRAYLKLKNWNFKENKEDSLKAIKKYLNIQ